jgi:eukaryotic-like serine/threonine-protein kinase
VTLSAGSRLGPYEILGQIGAGGMGEVYRARDPRLGREVAIKVLPASFSQDADRLRRFEQEAKAAGVLNHPNITAVYDIGTSSTDGAPYVVQELLEGETLRAVLAGGRIAQRKAIDYATQVAHGLAAAHEKGIVHRDLKPENLFVTRDGRVKILDFGLAKLTQAEGAVSSATNLPTETKGTEPGVVLGTLGYMSPEQVRGKPADARSDIFSFGAILYEMLSGKRAFHGDSAADTMSAILREDPPDLSVTNQSISPALERVVRHCIEKNPEQRFHSAHDLAFDIEALSGTSAQVAVAPTRTRLRLMPLLLVGIGVFAGAAIAYLAARRAPAMAETAGLAGATFRRLTNLSGAENWPALSPDGQTVAFVHRAGNEADIWVQRAGGRNPIDLTPDCDGESYSPAFSPDGSLIAYGAQCSQGGGLFVMGATGENSRRLTIVGTSPAWSPDGKEIVYATELVTGPYGRTGTSAIWAVDVGTGKTRRLSADFDAVQPSVSPRGLRVAYWALPAGGGQRDIWTMPYKGLAAGEQPVPVTQDEAVDFNPIWGPDGRTLYYLSNRNGSMNLWRVAIDEATGKTLGPAEPLILPAREVGGFALSRDGRHAAYVVRENTFSLDRLVFDPGSAKLTGKPDQILGSSQEMADVDVTADGAFLAFDSRGGARDDLFLVESTGKNLRQITDDVPKDRGASFSPDGKRLAFHSDRGGKYQIWTIERDGSGLKQLSNSKDLIIEAQWSPDGRAVATNSGKSSAIVRLDERGIATGIEPIPPPAPDTFFDPLGWSPDGKSLAGSVIRLPDTVSLSLAVYSPGPGAVVRPVRGTEGSARIRRGAYLGTHFLLYVDRGLHIADLESGEHHVVLERPDVGGFQDVACARAGGLCFAVRNTDNADIWQMTLPETKAK